MKKTRSLAQEKPIEPHVASAREAKETVIHGVPDNLKEDVYTFDRQPDVNAIAHADEEMLIVIGDRESYSDGGGMIGESLIRVSATDGSRLSLKTLKEVVMIDSPVDRGWLCPQVSEIYPGASVDTFDCRVGETNMLRVSSRNRELRGGETRCYSIGAVPDLDRDFRFRPSDYPSP